MDLTASQRAALVAQLEGLEAQVEDSGQAQAARAARGAALAVQGGTKLTSVPVTGTPLRAGLRADAAMSGTLWAMGYQLDGGACPIALSIPGVDCSLATFRAGFDVSASAPAPSSSADGFPCRSSAWHSPAPPRAR